MLSSLLRRLALLAAAASILASGDASAQPRSNPNCPVERVFFNPDQGQDIVLPRGFKVSVFAKDLNFPTGIAFDGDKRNFRVLVVESGKGLPSGFNEATDCNSNNKATVGGPTSPNNPFTPNIAIFDQNGRCLAGRPNFRGGCASGPIGKPGSGRPSFQKDGPAIGLAFEHGFRGGTLFATDSNQGVRGAVSGGGNNTSRVVTVHVGANAVNPFIDRLPTGDHPTELIVVKDGFIYWSQGSATNSGVTGHDNGGGGNQHDIACQDIVLSQNLFDSGDGHLTSGFSNHNQRRSGMRVPAFESAANNMHACTGAILRARIHTSNPAATVEPFSWGYRNPFGLRFAPEDHALEGGLFVTENGEDERGARPTNNAPDRLALARQNRDGSPDFHGWPDMFGFLDSTQAIFDPQGGPGDDLCVGTRTPPGFVCRPEFKAKTTPVRHVLDHFPQPATAPLAIEPTDVAVVGPDFAPDSFTSSVVREGAALVAREGDFGFSPANGKPVVGHDIELVNFSERGKPLELSLSRFAFNCRRADQEHNPDGSARCKDDPVTHINRAADQAFVESTADRIFRGINRPIQVQFGPDGALYLVDYGAVRDFGQSNPKSKFTGPTDGPLVQIPETGVIWKIERIGRDDRDDDEKDDD